MQKPVGLLSLYLLHPAPIWEIADNGHVDAAVMAFLLGGFAWGTTQKKRYGAATAMTLGALVKPTAALALPALWRPLDWRLPAFVIAIAVACYLPFLSAGLGVIGFLPSYFHENGLDNGEGFFVLALAQRLGFYASWMPGAYIAFAGLLITGLSLNVALSHDNSLIDALRGTALLLIVFLLLLSPNSPLVFSDYCVVRACTRRVDSGGHDDRRVPTLFIQFRFCRILPTLGLQYGFYRAHACLRFTHPPQEAFHSMNHVNDAAPGRPPADVRHYHDAADPGRPAVTQQLPICLYLEVTNRCNLLCTTCPRTYAQLERPADLSWHLFTRIVDQLPGLSRAVLHGVGEPMLVAKLPRMVEYLKDRGVYVLFNTNGTVLNDKNGRALISAGLDELRVSLDASNRESFLTIRGKDYFNRILRNVRRFRDLQEAEGHPRPRVSAWLTGLKETIAELPEFVSLAADIGIREVYLQRLVYFDKDPIGFARSDQALFERMNAEDAVHLAAAERRAKDLGIAFSASGAASEPGASLRRSTDANPWSLCSRPWTVMYITANGRALPCCIAPFSQHGYENYTLGDATQQDLREIWEGEPYQDFRKALQSGQPKQACASCGLRWSL